MSWLAVAVGCQSLHEPSKCFVEHGRDNRRESFRLLIHAALDQACSSLNLAKSRDKQCLIVYTRDGHHKAFELGLTKLCLLCSVCSLGLIDLPLPITTAKVNRKELWQQYALVASDHEYVGVKRYPVGRLSGKRYAADGTLTSELTSTSPARTRPVSGTAVHHSLSTSRARVRSSSPQRTQAWLIVRRPVSAS